MKAGQPPEGGAQTSAGMEAGAPQDPVRDSQHAYVTLLFNKYRSPLFRYLTRFVSVDDANELVQETYFRLLRHGNTEQMEAMARAFLFQTATNLLRDHYRRAKSRHADAHAPIDDAELPAAGDDPSESLAGEQTLQVIERTLRDMPDEMRRIFVLYRYRDLGYDEIATAMRVSRRTVARRIAEAMDRLGDAVRKLL